MACGRLSVGRAFILLEVVISLTIMAVAVSVALRSFSQSLRAARLLEVRTQAVFFAHQLLDEFEINPPPLGTSEGGFGDDFAPYYYTVTVDYAQPEYTEINYNENVSNFFPMRLMTIEISYDDGRHKPIHAVRLDTAIMGFERFSQEFKRQFYDY